jgi:hypothetical protein
MVKTTKVGRSKMFLLGMPAMALVFGVMVSGGVFAQEENAQQENPVVEDDANAKSETAAVATHKHSAGDMLLGLNWSFLGLAMNTNPMDAFSKIGEDLKFTPVVNGPNDYSVKTSIDLPQFYATARIINLGLSYEYYIFHWMSVGTGLGFGPEINVVTKGGATVINISGVTTEDEAKKDAMKQVSKSVHIQAGLFLTIPFNVHFNIPKVEWLYGGLGLEIHIPVSDAGLDSLLGADIAKYLPGGSIKGETFVSLPIDLGFDFSRTTGSGKAARSRLYFRLEPEFFGEGLEGLPFSLIWQSNLWKLANVAIPGAK